MLKWLRNLLTNMSVMTPEEFNAVYWASKSPAVAQLNSLKPFSTERTAKAVELAQTGEKVDMDIDAYGMSPWHTMKLRSQYGYTWVPAINQEPIPVAPGLFFPGLPLYDPTSSPAGSVKVSVDPADYPQVAPPLPPQPPVSGVPAEPNWVLAVNGWAPVLPLDTSPNGFVYNGVNGKWLKVVINTPWGASAYWLQQ